MGEVVRANPYIGPTAFTESDSSRFFGRTGETRELVSLVIARRAVLLYAESGSGKTSLLQASLIPELKRRKRVETFPIGRVMASAEVAGNVYVENALASLFPDAAAGSFAGKTFTEALATLLATGTKAQQRHPHLAIFDQFEEIFTFHPELTEQRRAFFEQLGQCLDTYPQLSLLLSMREDYLADLDVYAALLPDRIRTRMRLERLGVMGAVAAIREPAALGGLPFAAGVAEELVDNLRRIRTGAAAGTKGFALGEFVEPVQLQIVCRQLWSRLEEVETPKKAEIDSEDLQNYANVDDALIRFYRDSLAKAKETGVTERSLRRWFGEKLITPAGTRGLVYRGKRDTEGLRNAAVEILRDCYIIRGDLRGGEVWYELAHDRLVDPVLEDNENWSASYRNPIAEALEGGSDNLLAGRGLAEGLRYARENPEELTPEEGLFLKRSAEEESRAKRRRRKLIASTVAVMLILIAVAGWAIVNAQKAREQEGKAQEAAIAAQAAQVQAEHASGIANIAFEKEKESLQEEQVAKQEAIKQRNSAEFEKKQAAMESDRNSAHELAGAAVNSFGEDEDLGRLLALQAASLTFTNGMADREVQEALLRTIKPFAFGNLGSSHTAAINSLAYSPDGSRIVTASADGTARIWNASSGLCLLTLAGHMGSVNTAAFSFDGKSVATGGLDRTVRIWDAGSGSQTAILEGHYGAVLGVAFSPVDKTQLATAGKDGTAKLWDLSKCTVLKTMTSDTNSLNAVAFSPDGARIATASDSGYAKLWSVSSGADVTPLSPGQPKGPPTFWHQGQVSSVAFSPNGKLLATAGSVDGVVKIWQADSGEQVRALIGHTSGVKSVSFSPDGGRIASASLDRTARVWDVASGAELVMAQPPSAVKNTIVFGSIAYGPNGRFVTGGTGDGAAEVWDEGLGQNVAVLNGNFAETRLAFSGDGKLIAVRRNGANRIAVRDTWSGVELFALALGSSGSNSTYAARFSANGRFLAVTVFGKDETLQVWDVAQRRPAHDSIKIACVPNMISVSGDGGRVASICGSDLKVWESATGLALPLPPELKGRGFMSVAFSSQPGVATMALGGGDGVVNLWDGSSAHALALTANGASAHRGGVNQVVFSDDGNSLMTMSAHEQRVKIWNPRSSGIQSEFPCPGCALTAISPNGSLLAIANGQVVKLFDVKQREELLSIPFDRFINLAFSSNGQNLRTLGIDSAVRLYPLDLGRAMDFTRTELHRSWSAEECGKYLHARSCPQWTSALKKQVESQVSFEEDAEARQHSAGLVGSSTGPERLKAELLFLKGKNLAWSGREDLATQAFQQAQELHPITGFSPKVTANLLASAAHLAKGRNLAMSGDTRAALVELSKAKELDTTLSDLDPTKEANQLAAQSLVNQGDSFARKNQIEKALGKYAQAKALYADSVKFSPESQARSIAATGLANAGNVSVKLNNIEDAIAKFTQAQKLDPNSFRGDPKLVANQSAAQYFGAQGVALLRQHRLTEAFEAYSNAAKAYDTSPTLDPNGQARANLWNSLCWVGSLNGHAAAVLEDCNKAVSKMEALKLPSSQEHDSRGLARALSGDLNGAVEDFKIFSSAFDNERTRQRKDWIEKLQKSGDPKTVFTEDLLYSLAEQ